MTAVIGIREKNKVYLGCDSAFSNNVCIYMSSMNKVFKNSGYLIGYSGSLKHGEIIKHLKLPKCNDLNIDRFMVNDLMPFIARNLPKSNSVELLIGFKGRLFHMQSDMSVISHAENFDAIGVGSQYSIGALYALRKTNLLSKQKIRIALEITERFCPSVRRPFKILSI